MIEPYDVKQDKKAEAISELAQKLYEEDGFAGNLAKASHDLWRRYDERAASIVEEQP